MQPSYHKYKTTYHNKAAETLDSLLEVAVLQDEVEGARLLARKNESSFLKNHDGEHIGFYVV